MAVANRAQKMLFSPRSEWQVVASEPATVGSLYGGYIVPLALIGPVCMFITQLGRPVPGGLVTAFFWFVLSLVAVYVIGGIAAAVAPSFGGARNQLQGLKWAAYSHTSIWVAGIFYLIPRFGYLLLGFGGLLILIGGIYSLYLLWLGTVPLMRVPLEKASGYAVVVILCTVVLYIAIGSVIMAANLTMADVSPLPSSGGLYR